MGKSLPISALSHERLSNRQGLAIFASDSLSSTAYATEEILLVLILGGASFLAYSLPVALAIVGLIFITILSYRQIIHSHPQGGGAYYVAKKHLGELPSLLVAASLIFDYILTAAVSISAGVAAITSALPELYDSRVFLSISFIIFLTFINLRGVRESGKVFTIPTYLFIVSLFFLIIVGIAKYITGGFVISPLDFSPEEGLGLAAVVLIIRAFAAGCTAMTGLEATADGVQSFKAPEAQNANKVLLLMGVTLAAIFIGVTLLAALLHIMPKEGETVISQIARETFGTGFFYFLIQMATALILFLAANTPFSGLPRLSAILAKDLYFPRQFFTLGKRLVYTNGIFLLAIFSGLLIFLFQGNVHALIPLYAVGVFLGFTLAQWGMVEHWKEKEKNDPSSEVRGKKFINGTGAVATGIVLLVVLLSKFTHGAWVVLPSLFFLIVLMRATRAHYVSVRRQLSLETNTLKPIPPDRTAVLLISNVHQGTLKGIEAAKNIYPAHIRAVHIAIDDGDARLVKKLWKKYGEGILLDIVPSPEREIISPLVKYIETLERRWENDRIIVVIPEFVPGRPWEHALHSQTAIQIRWALSHFHDVEILDVPYRLKHGHSLDVYYIIANTLWDFAKFFMRFGSKQDTKKKTE